MALEPKRTSTVDAQSHVTIAESASRITTAESASRLVVVPASLKR
jgi:hypothetical protein